MQGFLDELLEFSGINISEVLDLEAVLAAKGRDGTGLGANIEGIQSSLVSAGYIETVKGHTKSFAGNEGFYENFLEELVR